MFGLLVCTLWDHGSVGFIMGLVGTGGSVTNLFEITLHALP